MVTFSANSSKRDWNSSVFSLKAKFQHKNQKDFTAPSVLNQKGILCFVVAQEAGGMLQGVVWEIIEARVL